MEGKGALLLWRGAPPKNMSLFTQSACFGSSLVGPELTCILDIWQMPLPTKMGPVEMDSSTCFCISLAKLWKGSRFWARERSFCIILKMQDWFRQTCIHNTFHFLQLTHPLQIHMLKVRATWPTADYGVKVKRSHTLGAWARELQGKSATSKDIFLWKSPLKQTGFWEAALHTRVSSCASSYAVLNSIQNSCIFLFSCRIHLWEQMVRSLTEATLGHPSNNLKFSSPTWRLPDAWRLQLISSRLWENW